MRPNITAGRLNTALFFFLAATAAVPGAQGQRAISPGAIPIEEEPQHKIAIKNDFVRIVDATLPPGYVTKDHIHAADSVSVNVANGRQGEEAVRGIGRASFSRGGYSHVVTNSQQGVVRYIVVEPLKADRANAPPAALPSHTLETENDRVRIYRVRLGAGESLDSHVHPAGRVDITIAGPGGAGSFSWIAATENRPLKAPVSGPVEIVEIEPK